jgi:three-Cys-motif partner protein
MAKQRFGGDHTVLKLEKLEAYLKAYTQALSKQRFRLVFFDAFAGTGDIQISEADQKQHKLFAQDDYQLFTLGSAQRALGLQRPFHEYIFIEKSRGKTLHLEKLKEKFPSLANRITIKKGDGNNELKIFCANTNWGSTRAVVFLDPFGNQVNWATILEVAKTKAIDLWYLFPAGLGVYRQIGEDGSLDDTHTASMDSLLGTKDWRSAFIGETEDEGLFGSHKKSEKIATPDSITRYMIDRMKNEFAGGVLDVWLPLGSKGIHMYSLLFACANPSVKANQLARKLALAVLKGKSRGRT